MPQELHVVQCYSCQMYQVDIVKKVNKWKCKLCNEKQSLKQVYFQGSGKECRLQVMKLNELKGIAERSVLFNEDFGSCASESSGTLEEAKPAIQTQWSDFVDEGEDAIYDKVFYGLSSDCLPGAGTFSNRMSKPEDDQKFTVTEDERRSVPSTRDNIQIKRIHEEVTNCFSESEIPVTKMPKIATQSEWDKFLPDELSD